MQANEQVQTIISKLLVHIHSPENNRNLKLSALMSISNYKVVVVLALARILVLPATAQDQNMYQLDKALVTRQAFHIHNDTYILANHDKSGYVLKLNRNLVLDTLATFSGTKNPYDFHNLYVDIDRNIFIAFDQLQNLYLNDSLLYSFSGPAHVIVCLNQTGKVMWSNYFFRKGLLGTAFCFSGSNRKGIYFGQKVTDQIIIGSDTVENKRKETSVVIQFTERGGVKRIIDYSKYYTSSTLYGLKIFKHHPIAITISNKNESDIPGRTIQKVHKQKAIRKTFIDTDSLQLIDAITHRGKLYLLTWEDYVVKTSKRHVKKITHLRYDQPAEVRPQSSIEQKRIFYNNRYLSIISYYENREPGKKWDDLNSLKGVMVMIIHLNRDNLGVISVDKKYIENTKNWVRIKNCNQEILEVIVDGQYRRM